MQEKLGENIASEWEHDPFADQVWDALQLIRAAPEDGLSALLTLGEKNSALALMYAGNNFAKGTNNIQKNEELAIKFLKKSFDLGSIEGGYILADIQMSNCQYGDAFKTYNSLIKLDYSPAMYVLGYHYVFGLHEIRKYDEGEKLFERAAYFGHFYAQREFANLLIRRNNICKIIKGIIIIVKSLIPYVYFRYYYPNSDRLRT